MKRTIYMSAALEQLADKTRGASRRAGGFSRRLGEIVERYQLVLDLESEKLPDLTDAELEIMRVIVMGAVIDARKIRGLHLDPLDATIGTPGERRVLADKIEPLTAAQRLALIERVEGNAE